MASLSAEVDLLAYPVGKDVSISGLRVMRCRNPLGYQTVPIGFSLRKVVLDLCMLPQLLALIRRNEYDVVHVLEEMALPTIFLCRRLGRPVVYDMQSSIPSQLRSHPVLGSSPGQAVLRRIERWMVRKADAIVCSAGLLDHVKSIDPDSLAREWLYMGQAPMQSTAEPSARRTELGFEPDARLVVYSGTFEPYQGLELLLEAMLRVLQVFPKAVLLLIGAPTGHELADNPIAANLISSRQLKVVRRQSRGDVPAYLALAEVLVSPRAYGDNVPLKIFDYMVAGKPIVATNIRAHRSLLTEETAILVDSTPDSMAAGISRLLTDPDLGAGLAERALRVAGRHHDGESFGERVRALYLDAMNRDPDRVRHRPGEDLSP